MMRFGIGDTVGEYKIIGVVGSGAVGHVFKVEHLITRRIEAIKVLSGQAPEDDPQAQRFVREIQVQAKLSHPNIAAVHNAFWWQGHLVMVMEFVEGESLESLLKRGALPLSAAIDYIDQALAGLEYAHAHDVVHRDIKPANLLITPSGTVKLTDFGLAKTLKAPDLTETGNILGSLFYMSPEQVQGVRKLDGRADLYSLTAVLYEAATGRRTFDVEESYFLMVAHVTQTPVPPSEVNPSLPAGLDEVILRGLEKDPYQRFQTASEFRESLARVSSETAAGIQAQKITVELSSQSPRGAVLRSRAFLVSVCGFLLVLGGLLLLRVHDPSANPSSTHPKAILTEGTPPSPGRLRKPRDATSAKISTPSPEKSNPVEESPRPTAEPPRSGEVLRQSLGIGDEPKSSPTRLAIPHVASLPSGTTSCRYQVVQSFAPADSVWALQFSPDGRWLAAGTGDNSLRIWDTATGEEVATLQGHTAPVVTLSFSSDGSRLASGSWDGTAKVWDIDAKRLHYSFRHKKDVASVALSRDGRRLAVGSADKTIRVWDVGTRAEVHKLRGHKRTAQALTFNPSGDLLASVSAEKTVLVWRLAPSGERYDLEGLDFGATAVRFSRNGQLLAVAGSDQVNIWNVHTRREVRTVDAPGWLHALALGSSGGFVALGATSESLGLCDVATSRQISAIPGARARCIALGPGGRQLAAGTNDGTIRIWEVSP